MDSNTVDVLVAELEDQLAALDEVLSISKLREIVTHEQLDAIKRITPTVHGLVNCFNDQKKMLLLRKDGTRRLSAPDGTVDHVFSAQSSRNLMKSAVSPSARMILNDVLEQSKPRRRHKTVFVRSDSDDGDEIENISKLPKDLLIKMINSEKTPAGRTSVAYIAQTYGGVQLPQDFSKRKPTLKNVATKVINSNVFVKGLVHGTFGITETSRVTYLPTEFRLLDLKKKIKLARLLTWNNLQVWGFNAFEVETISSHRKFSLDNGMTAPDDIDASLNEMNIESTERGCPVVLIGWAILASPYAQVRWPPYTRENNYSAESYEQFLTESERFCYAVGYGQRCQ
jgi:hypothetical protein